MKKTILALGMALALMAMSSCSSSKEAGNLRYFQDLTEVSGSFDTGNYQSTIQPDNELMITVTSTQPEATAAYNLPLSNPTTTSSLGAGASTPRQPTFLVDPQGDIDFPILGRIHVAGMTTTELAQKLTEMISKDVIDPVVLVRQMSFSVNVMGEVNAPGKKYASNERMSILDALAAAGDLTPYGERTSLLLIREEDGKRTYNKIDLTDSSLLSSPLFYLRPNDVIIVMPNKIRQDNAKYNQFSSYKLSVISTVVSACSIIASLIIALAVK